MVKQDFIIKLRALFFTILISLTLIIVSELTEDWFSGGSGACSWKANSTGIYSSLCIIHQTYDYAKCHNGYYICDCCDDFDIDTVRNLKDFRDLFAFLLFVNFIFILECAIIVWNTYYEDAWCRICERQWFRYFRFLVDKTCMIVTWIIFFIALNSNTSVKWHSGVIIRIITMVFISIMQLFIMFIRVLAKCFPCLENCYLENRTNFMRDVFICCFSKKPKEAGAQDREVSNIESEDIFVENFENDE
jgi:hypothetical protein